MTRALTLAWFVLPAGDLSPVTIDALPPATEAFASVFGP